MAMRMIGSKIDSTARVEDGAVIGEGTTIGPYCIVGANVTIGVNCKLVSHVSIVGHTTIGEDCTIYPFASLGAPPQILNLNESGRLRIGNGCTIREYVTMNSGSPKGGGLTTVGDRGYFMNCAHVGHDCHVGNDVIFATSATLGGHCDVGDFVFMGGLSAAHQFTRIGPQVMVGGVCGIRGDIIPFGLVNGQYAALEGLNIIGMKRRAFTRERIMTVRGFYQKLFHGEGVFSERLDSVASMAGDDPAIADILAFIGGGKHRSLCMPADGAAA